MLNYEISGTGKEKLVLLHGFMENLLIWEEMEAFLAAMRAELQATLDAGERVQLK